MNSLNTKHKIANCHLGLGYTFKVLLNKAGMHQSTGTVVVLNPLLTTAFPSSVVLFFFATSTSVATFQTVPLTSVLAVKLYNKE